MTTKMLHNGLPFHIVTERSESDLSVSPTALSRRFVALLMAVTVIALTVTVLTLTTFPAIHTDEAWYANLAQNWIKTGNRTTTLDIGPLPNGEGQGTTILGAVPTRLAIQVWGLSLRAIRLPSLLAGLALLAVVAGLGYLLWPGHSGPLAALVLLAQPLFLLGSHIARPDMWLALVVVMALGCSVLGWRRDQPLWDVVAGLLAVLSLDLHQNGAVFCVGLAASYLARYGRTVVRQKSSLAFFSVSVPGALIYLYRSVGWLLPGKASNSAGVVGIHTSHSIPLLSGNPIEWLVNELVRYLLYFGNEPLGALLLALGIMVALRRRGKADRLLLAWLAGSALAMMLLVSHMLETYLLPMLSVGALLVGRGMAGLVQHEEPWGRQVVALTFGVLTLPLVLTLGQSGTHRTAQLQRELQATVPCDRILGPNQYWLAFTNCDYRSWDVVSHYHHIHGASLEASMAAIRPDYLLIDRTIVEKLREDFDVGGQTGTYYALPRAEFQRFLDERTTLVGWLTTPAQDTIQIRQVHWETEP